MNQEKSMITWLIENNAMLVSAGISDTLFDTKTLIDAMMLFDFKFEDVCDALDSLIESDSIALNGGSWHINHIAEKIEEKTED